MYLIYWTYFIHFAYVLNHVLALIALLSVCPLRAIPMLLTCLPEDVFC